MGRHVRDVHNVSIRDHEPVSCYVQVLFHSNETRYPVALPQCVLGPVKEFSMLDYATSTYRAIFDVQPQLEDRAHLNPFLAKYDWLPIVEKFTPRNIHDWTSLPDETDATFRGLEAAVKSYYNRIIQDMGNLGQYTTILRWVKSSKRCVYTSGTSGNVNGLIEAK